MDVELNPLNCELFEFEAEMDRLEEQVMSMQRGFTRMVAEYHKMKLMKAAPDHLFRVQTQLVQARFALDECLMQLAHTHHTHKELTLMVECKLAEQES